MIKNRKLTLRSAFIVTAMSKYSRIIINLVFTIILARLLTPEDYGIVAVTNVFINFFAVFSDMGISVGVIQNKELTDEDNNNIYSFSVYFGIVLSVIFALFSFLMARFYQNNIYIPIGFMLSVSLLFTTLNMVPNALLMKEKKLGALAVRAVISAILSGIITVILAAFGWKYYALVVSNIFGSCFIYIWNKKYVNLHFKKVFSMQSIKKIFSFSLFQFAFNFVNYFSKNMDNILTGRYMGAKKLGYYDKAFTLTQHPISALANVVAPVLHPFLSEHSKEKEYIYKKHIDIVRIFLIFGFFVSGILFFYSEDIIMVLYGERWAESAPCLKWLGVSLWAQLSVSCSSAIYQSLGDTKKLFMAGSFNAGISMLCIILGIYSKHILILSQMVSAAYFIHFFIINYILVKLIIKKSVFQFVLSFWKEWLMAIILFVFGNIRFFCIENNIINLFAGVCYLGMVYFIALVITGEGKALMDMVGVKKFRILTWKSKRNKGKIE